MKIDELNEKLRKNKLKLEKIERENNLNLSKNNSLKRKKRARNLIMLGALFEAVDLDKEHANSLLGFLIQNKELYLKNREEYFKIGEISFKERKSSVKTNDLNRQVTEDEIKELLKLFSKFEEKGLNMGVIIQQEFRKKLFSELTLKEFQILKNYM
ncbi:MAG: conjugal transfer protein TraD [Cetobacterium sp.]